MRVIESVTVPPDYLFVRHIEGELEATLSGVTLRFENDEQAVMLANAILELTTGPRRSSGIDYTDALRVMADWRHRMETDGRYPL